jgi:hypothetical protein
MKSEPSMFDETLGIEIHRLEEKERYYIEYQDGCVFYQGRYFAYTFMSYHVCIRVCIPSSGL